MPENVPHYRRLKPAEVSVLIAIWRLETERRPATTPNVLEALSGKINDNRLRRIICELRKVGDDLYVVSESYPTGERGNRVEYKLSETKLITIPLTALMVIELLQIPRETGDPINRERFCGHLKDKYGYDLEFWTSRIQMAIDRGYIHELSSQYIALHDRARFEYEYLTTIASAHQQRAKT